MGDSDDDVDYKRRDKFHTERRGYDRSIDRGVSPRHDHNEWRESGFVFKCLCFKGEFF